MVVNFAGTEVAGDMISTASASLGGIDTASTGGGVCDGAMLTDGGGGVALGGTGAGAAFDGSGAGSVWTGSLAGATIGLDLVHDVSEFCSSHSAGDANASGALRKAVSATTDATAVIAALRFGFIVFRHFSHPPSLNWQTRDTLLSQIL